MSIISEDYMQQNRLDAEIKYISHIQHELDSMRVQWENQVDILLRESVFMLMYHS